MQLTQFYITLLSLDRRTSLLVSLVWYLVSWCWWGNTLLSPGCCVPVAGWASPRCLRQPLLPLLLLGLVVNELGMRVGVSSAPGCSSAYSQHLPRPGEGLGTEGPQHCPPAWTGDIGEVHCEPEPPSPWGEVWRSAFCLSPSALPRHPCWHWQQSSPAALIHTPLLQTGQTEYSFRYSFRYDQSW